MPPRCVTLHLHTVQRVLIPTVARYWHVCYENSRGQAATAYFECAYTAMAAATLNSCYVRTGAGWCAQLSQAGQVVWTPFTGPMAALKSAGLPAH